MSVEFVSGGEDVPHAEALPINKYRGGFSNFHLKNGANLAPIPEVSSPCSRIQSLYFFASRAYS
ncbi:MAG TPA: hypothetical protein VG271_18655, partial [Beijerinckiaceae bacterium]|nr:hypothetical protein [Beijerinckiaceae bacterium]